jgi:hypothetical protein
MVPIRLRSGRLVYGYSRRIPICRYAADAWFGIGQDRSACACSVPVAQGDPRNGGARQKSARNGPSRPITPAKPMANSHNINDFDDTL